MANLAFGEIFMNRYVQEENTFGYRLWCEDFIGSDRRKVENVYLV